MPVMRVAIAFLVTLSLALISGCGSGNASVDGVPTTLKMAYLPSEEDVERRMQVFTELAEYLTSEIGIPVEIIRTSSYGPMIEAMRARKVDFGQAGGSFTYIIAHEKAGVEAIVSRGTPQGPSLYTSLIVTSPETGIRSMEELKARQSDLVFAFVDPASTSGHLVPRAGLESHGIVPEEFDRTVFTMSHTNSAMTLMSAKVDAGALSRGTYNRLIERERMEEGDLVILWESAPIPTGPIVVGPDLPVGIQAKIQAAYLKLNDGGPLMDALRDQTGIDDMIYYPIDDTAWDGLREIAYNVDTMKLLERQD